ncbi:hypothetical protein FQR65_LT12592 [Abscondita terminalis]|nr:hypothetical protein FQR65_LT12592 [Abscondita terminalis]
MNPFVTTYKEDFIKKTAKRRTIKYRGSEFPNPISEGFRNYLQLSSDQTPLAEPTEIADAYLHKHEANHPKLAKIYFEKPVDDEVMTKEFIYNGRTIYQCDYCDLEKDNAYKEEIRIKNLFRLPDDWNIPLSTQKYCHRNPIDINPNAMEGKHKMKIVNNLDPQHHIREILKVTTGKSEYGHKLGEVGELVMNDELHGTVPLV